MELLEMYQSIKIQRHQITARCTSLALSDEIKMDNFLKLELDKSVANRATQETGI